VVSCAQVCFRHGDDVALVRERRGTTPLAHIDVRRSLSGDDGPTRSVLLGWISRSSEGSPVMAGSAPLTTIVEPAANQLPHRRPGVALPAMSDHTYRVIEIVGSSPDGIDAAIRNAVSRASETMRGLDWFEMESVRGHLEDGAVGHFQVTLKVGFRLEDPH